MGVELGAGAAVRRGPSGGTGSGFGGFTTTTVCNGNGALCGGRAGRVMGAGAGAGGGMAAIVAPRPTGMATARLDGAATGNARCDCTAVPVDGAVVPVPCIVRWGATVMPKLGKPICRTKKHERQSLRDGGRAHRNVRCPSSSMSNGGVVDASSSTLVRASPATTCLCQSDTRTA